MRKSIYVKEEDLELFEWAESISDSVSSVIVHALRELRERGIKEIPPSERTDNSFRRIADSLERYVQIEQEKLDIQKLERKWKLNE